LKNGVLAWLQREALHFWRVNNHKRAHCREVQQAKAQTMLSEVVVVVAVASSPEYYGQ
jgi:hypothetical protein